MHFFFFFFLNVFILLGIYFAMMPTNPVWTQNMPSLSRRGSSGVKAVVSYGILFHIHLWICRFGKASQCSLSLPQLWEDAAMNYKLLKMAALLNCQSCCWGMAALTALEGCGLWEGKFWFCLSLLDFSAAGFCAWFWGQRGRHEHWELFKSLSRFGVA